MARFAFLTWDGAGNQAPAVGIAKALIAGGHEVLFAGYAAQRAYFERRDLPFRLLQHASASWRDLSAAEMFQVKLDAAWAAEDHLDDLPKLLAAASPSVIVVDCLMFGALAFLEKLGFPAVVLVHSTPGALLPPGGPFEAQLLPAVNRLRAKLGLDTLVELWGAWDRFPALCTSIPALDPLAGSAPRSWHYVGPVFEDAGPGTWSAPWDADDRRRLVLVSFSTGPYWDQRSRIQRTLDGLSCSEFRILVTPGRTDVSGIQLPTNAVVAVDLPHSRVLPQAAATVTHAGHGTVAASLLHGVPLVCLPNPAGDQPALAAHVAALGAGITLDGEAALPSEIGSAVCEVTATPSYARTARRLSASIKRFCGAYTAAGYLERMK